MASTAAQSISSVHLGMWTNWSSGVVRGATITLTRRDGGLLTAFIALFITYAGTRFWRIVCFLIHHALSSAGSQQDALYHQRQVVLRNAANGVSGIWGLLHLGWAWRRRLAFRDTFSRVFPIIAFSSACVVGFAVAGIFSSQISTKSGNEVLILSATPGYVDLALGTSTPELTAIYATFLSEKTVQDANYARQCYKPNASDIDCPIYVKPSLPVLTTYNASCPFQETVCRSQDSNLILDSGLIDSLADLGINAPPKYRFQTRYITHCAPIMSEGFTSSYNTSGGSQFLRFHYGKYAGGLLNFTYEYPSTRIETTELFDSAAGLDYTIGYVDSSSFEPNLAFQTNDSFVSLFFLSSNSVQYLGTTDDPWYYAHTKSGHQINAIAPNATGYDSYYSDDPARVLGCTEQVFFCNPHSAVKCVALPGEDSIDDAISQQWPNGTQNSYMKYVSKLLTGGSMALSTQVATLGVSSLASRDTLLDGVQSSPGTIRWQSEVINWHTTQLANLQRLWVEAATGQSNPALDSVIAKPETPQQWRFLRNQKVRSNAYTNFSVLGMALTFGIGGLIIVVSYTLEPLVAWYQKRKNLDGYARLEWVTNETFQLQRMAHEELGLGTWKRGAKLVPMTERDDVLGVLDISDPEHPLLRAPARKVEIVKNEKSFSDHGTPSKINQQLVPVTISITAEDGNTRTNDHLGKQDTSSLIDTNDIVPDSIRPSSPSHLPQTSLDSPDSANMAHDVSGDALASHSK